MQTIETVKQEYQYIAIDGKRFSSADDCVSYEKWLSDKDRLSEIPNITTTWDYDMPFTDWYYVTNLEQAQLVERSFWVKSNPLTGYKRYLSSFKNYQFPCWIGFYIDSSADYDQVHHTSLVEQIGDYERILLILKSVEALTPDKKGFL